MASILLAEDDTSLCSFLTKALQNAGHHVTSFTDGKSALSALKTAQKNGDEFDLLLTDIVMPEMDGIELAQKASGLCPDLKVMFITGFAAIAMARQGDKSKINADDDPNDSPKTAAPGHAKILSKPFHLKDLVDQVDHLLAA